MLLIEWGAFGREGIYSSVLIIDDGEVSFVKGIEKEVVCAENGIRIGGVDCIHKLMLLIEWGAFGRDGIYSAVLVIDIGKGIFVNGIVKCVVNIENGMRIGGVDGIHKLMLLIECGILGREGIYSVVLVIDIGEGIFVNGIVKQVVCMVNGMRIGGVDGICKLMLLIECGILGRDGMCSVVLVIDVGEGIFVDGMVNEVDVRK